MREKEIAKKTWSNIEREREVEKKIKRERESMREKEIARKTWSNM
jgi:hypothetical protein